MTMAHTTARLPFGSITVHRAISFAHDAVERYNRWNETRRTVAQLRALSPSQLDDIGLVPADIETYARTGRL